MNYKKELIKLMRDANVLRFGEFKLKSGRIAPYFINSGDFKTGEHLAKLGEFYAKCIEANNIDGKVYFGPAYKGIPLVVAAASAMYNNTGKSVNFAFNRKEAKDHGEGGIIVGHQFKDGESVVIIEDVITAGTAIRESLTILNSQAKLDVNSVVILVDRMERGKGELSAVQEVKKEFGINVYPIVTILDIIEAIKDGVIDGKEYLEAMIAYRDEYGVE